MKRIYTIIITILLILSTITFFIIGNYMIFIGSYIINLGDQYEIDHEIMIQLMVFLGVSGLVLIIFNDIEWYNGRISI